MIRKQWLNPIGPRGTGTKKEASRRKTEGRRETEGRRKKEEGRQAEGRRKEERRRKKEAKKQEAGGRVSFCVFAHLARRLSGHESRGKVAAERLKAHTHAHRQTD
eukprot:COSAG06_NODE_37513_length_434_cov_1.044776_1_plen_104_part_01